MSEVSNNPFIDRSASVTSRYPNINDVSSPGFSSPAYSSPGDYSQLQSGYPQPSSSFVGGYSTQPQYTQQPQWTQQQTGLPQLQQPYSPGGFQPSNGFGQQPIGQMNSYQTGYPQQQQYSGYPQQGYATGYQQAQSTGYGFAGQQPQYAGNPALAQFDPYAGLGQPLSPSASTPSAPPFSSTSTGAPPAGTQHPRVFIQTHKAELEAWDPPAWKQVQNTFDELKAAWDRRKRAAEAQVKAYGGVPGAPPGGQAGFFGGGYGTGYGAYQTPQQQEIDRLNSIIKEAAGYIDTIAASSIQMQEVFAGYRHSGDIASKRRVRESCNAALTGLPEYPPLSL